jgi:hypothetical protein
MSRFQQSIDLCLSRTDAHAVCVAAILGLQWHIAGDAEGRIACQEAVDEVSQGISPARIVLSLTGCSHGPTRVMLNGAAFGSGSEQRVHVRRRVELLAQAIEEQALGLAADAVAQGRGQVLFYRLNGAEMMRRGFEDGRLGWPGRDGVPTVVGGCCPTPAVLPPSVALAEASDHDRVKDCRATGTLDTVQAPPS